MTIRARVADNFMLGGVSVLIEDRGDGYRRVLRFDGGRVTWDLDGPEGVVTEPTMSLPDEAARPLLDALLRWYQGAEDMRTTRADLMHERGRVDKCLTALIEHLERQ